MEDNLESNNITNKELSDKTQNSNSEEINGTKLEKVINNNDNNTYSKNKSIPKVDNKNENDKPVKTIPKKDLLRRRT